MSQHTRTTRRSPRTALRLTAIAAIAGMALTACAVDPADNTPEGPDGDAPAGKAEIKFSWWGSDTRHELTQEVLDNFMVKYPDITVVSDFTDWGGYWDKLATTVAGGDTPDIFMQEERYLRDYNERDIMADLSQYEIDTSAIDETILATGQIDGGQYAIPTGVNVYAIAANPRVFEDAGLEVPDDTTWTWEEFADLAIEVGASGEDVYGMQDHGSNEAGFNVFARQRGESLYTEDGGLGYEDQTLIDWWNIALELQEKGGQPAAAETVEIGDRGPEQSLLGTGKGAMMATWTNQLTAIANAAGEELKLMRWPGESQHERTGMYFKPALYASMSSSTEHPEEAAKFLDFMLNSETAGEIILADLGLPANLDVRATVAELLPEEEKQSADFVEDLQDEIIDGPPVPPVGAGEVAAVLGRLNTEVLFERMTPEEAATQFRAEVEGIIGG